MIYNFMSVETNSDLKFGTKIPTQSSTLTYNGSVQSPSWNNYDTSVIELVSGGNATEVGTHTAVFRIKNPSKYVWMDKTEGDKLVDWTIGRAIISDIPTQNGTLTYNGNVQSPVWDNYDSAKLTVSGNTSAINAGTYETDFTPTSNYQWEDGSITAKSIDWEIGKKSITDIPSQSGTLTYNGNNLTPTWNNYNPLELDISGDISGVNAGDYTATFTPNQNCKWKNEVQQTVLPAGYTQLEYIENPNGAYINGGVNGLLYLNPFEQKNIEIKIKLNSSKDPVTIFGEYYYIKYASGTDTYDSCKLGFSNNGNNFRLELNSERDNFSTEQKQNAYIDVGNETEFIIKINGTSNGYNVILEANGKTTVKSRCLSQVMNLPLFAYLNENQILGTGGGYSSTISDISNFKFYYMKIEDTKYHNTDNIIPCVSPEGKVGVYRTNVNQFYGSSDEAKDFVAGPIAGEDVEDVSPVNVTWTISKAVISTVPFQVGTLVYDGNTLTPTWDNYNSNELTIGGQTSGVNANSYDATFLPTSNCKWWDDTTTIKSATWIISKADVTITVNPTNLFLDADNTSGEITVTRNSTGAITAISSNTDLATANTNYNVVFVTGIKSGDVSITVSVASDNNYNSGSINVPVVIDIPISEYTITASVNPDGSGTVTGTGVYEENTEVSLEATANDGYEFSNWTENSAEEPLSTENPYVFEAVRDIDLVANFEEHKSRLPDGYTEVEYISNPNLTSINGLGLSESPFANVRVELSIKNLVSHSGACNIFGNDYFYSIRTSSSGYSKRSNDNRIYYYENTVCLQTGYQGSSSSGSAATSISVSGNNFIIIVDIPKNLFEVNGQQKTHSISVSNQYVKAPSLFATSLYSQSKTTVNGTTTTTDTKNNNSTNFDFYTFKIYSSTSSETEELQHEYVPCISPIGEVGVFDIITETFWGSSDVTKPLVAGPSV